MPGSSKCEVRVASAIQRQIANLLLLHDAAHIRGLRIQQRRSRLHFQRLRHVTDLQCEINRLPGLHIDLHVAELLRAEAANHRFERVPTWMQRIELIFAGIVAGGVQSHIGGLVDQRNGSIRNARTTGIAHRSDDRPGIDLAEGCER